MKEKGKFLKTPAVFKRTDGQSQCPLIYASESFSQKKYTHFFKILHVKQCTHKDRRKDRHRHGQIVG